jgi:hypothetical protein
MKKRPATNQNTPRQNLLRRIREASFPADFDRFTGQELETAGLIHSNNDPRKDTPGYRHYVLLVTQAKELRKQRDGLASRVELLEHYHSPLWHNVWNEPCPIKEAELRRKAEADEARVNEQHRKERDPLAGLTEIWGKVKMRPWKSRDKRQLYYGFRPALWHEPMSVMDYRKATRLTRRTIQNMLDRLGARPIAQRKRPNEPARYDRHTNHKLLCDWLIRHVKGKEARQGWLTRTLVHCQHETPEHYTQLFKSIRPVLKSLGIQTPEQRQQFLCYMKQCKAILHPPLPPPLLLDPINDLLSGLTGLPPSSQ